jgi:hypothetical protein
MVTIKWAWNSSEGSSAHGMAIEVAGIDPVPALKHISSTRNKNNDDRHFISCPAFVDFFKNTYYILSPYDEHIVIDRQNGNTIAVNEFSQKMFDTYVLNRGKWIHNSEPYQLSLPPRIVFWSDESVVMESFPALQSTSVHNNIMPIPGTFNISKWIRPIDFTFEIIDDTKPIIIKRGDPLFCVRFLTENGERVELERTLQDERLEKAMTSCLFTKQMIRKKPFNQLYDMARPYLKLLGFGKK